MPRACPSVYHPAEKKLLSQLSSPAKIQAFLDSLKYSPEDRYRSPRSVMRDRMAHCFDGAVFAAAALTFHGRVPLILDLRAVEDDDHVLTVFKEGALFGAIGKSNYVGLRFREPIFRNLRELVLSYFEFYYNPSGKKTLRSYSRMLNLKGFKDWTTDDQAMDLIADKLDALPHVPLLSAARIRKLLPVDERSRRAGLMGALKAGLYKG